MGRILGVDYGEKRLGFALSDPMGIIASTHTMVTLEQENQAAREIIRICKETQPEKVVIGMPVNMNGTKGPSAQKVDAIMIVLRDRLSIPVVAWDERLTTKSAHDILIEGGMRREKRKLLVDKLAAQIMLQNYLDAQGG